MARASSAPASRPTAGRAHAARRRGHGGTLVGLFVGIAVGLGLAAAAAFYVMRTGNPYQAAATGNAREPGKDQGKGRIDAPPSAPPRFDFYKILPGIEEPKVQAKAPDKQGAERAAPDKAAAERAPPADRGVAKVEDRPSAPEKAPEPSPRAPRSSERIWLQAGSFASEADAENMKAQLALTGHEAAVQQATVPDKGVRYRVRLGPFDNSDEVNRVKSDLAKRGIDSAVIR
jgi:cell division protein FtsN